MTEKLMSQKETLLSVLMPAHNAALYIGEAIESILNQSYKAYDFIILDDASTDSTLEIIKQYQKHDKRIKVLENKKNKYIAESRNILVAAAKTKYIAWQDADDISLPIRLQEQVAYLESHPEVGIVGGYLEFFDEQGTKSIRKYHEGDAALRKRIFRYSPVAQPTAMIRRKCFTEFGLYNLSYPPAEDIDMSFRIGTKYKFANLPKVLLKYRDNQSSATYKKLKKIELSTLEIRRHYRKNPAYKVGAFDILYNILQYFSVYIIPPKVKIALFNRLRNEKNY